MKYLFRRNNQSFLLPNLSLLALLELVMMLLPGRETLAPIWMTFVLFYLAYIILVTRDMLVDLAKLHPIDRLLCRWSGPLAVAIGVGLVALVSLIGVEQPLKETWIGSRSGLFTIKYAMEVGLIFSVACWCIPRELGHVRPAVAWRVLVLPLLVIYGSYIVLLPLSHFFGDSDRDRPQVELVGFAPAGTRGRRIDN